MFSLNFLVPFRKYSIFHSLNNFQTILEIILSFIGIIFMSGVSWTYLDILRGTKSKIYPFRDFFRGFQPPFILGILLLTFLLTIFISLWTILFIIPGIIFKDHEIDYTVELKKELLNTIDEKLNEIAEEIVLKYNQDFFNVSSKLGKITMLLNEEALERLK